MSRRAAPLLALAAMLGGCGTPLRTLSEVGEGAAAISSLTRLLLWTCLLAYVITLGVAFWALLRRRRGEGGERPARRAIGVAIAVTALTLSFLVAASYRTDRALIAQERDAPVQVELTAHQWWWELRYLDPTPSHGFVTANELHIPVGVDVAVQLASADVIHSFWVPELMGKRDIIPGRIAVIHLHAREAGRWQGRCAEFCGYQHAWMLLTVVAEPQEAFDRWRLLQAAQANPPQTDAQKRGELAFTGGKCVSCHVVRGTSATGYSSIAPDLTHVMSRERIAAGRLPTGHDELAAWIVDPHRYKPGVHMPPNTLSAEDRDALVAFLESLK